MTYVVISTPSLWVLQLDAQRSPGWNGELGGARGFRVPFLRPRGRGRRVVPFYGYHWNSQLFRLPNLCRAALPLARKANLMHADTFQTLPDSHGKTYEEEEMRLLAPDTRRRGSVVHAASDVRGAEGGCEPQVSKDEGLSARGCAAVAMD